jgi:hypothetical protein
MLNDLETREESWPKRKGSSAQLSCTTGWLMSFAESMTAISQELFKAIRGRLLTGR